MPFYANERLGLAGAYSDTAQRRYGNRYDVCREDKRWQSVLSAIPAERAAAALVGQIQIRLEVRQVCATCGI